MVPYGLSTDKCRSKRLMLHMARASDDVRLRRSLCTIIAISSVLGFNKVR